jgi:uncharacterized membrane protein YebE (DUF533 family)
MIDSKRLLDQLFRPSGSGQSSGIEGAIFDGLFRRKAGGGGSIFRRKEGGADSIFRRTGDDGGSIFRRKEDDGGSIFRRSEDDGGGLFRRTGGGGGSDMLRMGGLALIGALAYKAFQQWQANQAPDPSPARPAELPVPKDTPFLPASEAGQQAAAQVVLQAMIAAAKADGHIDTEEQRRILGELDRLDVSSDERAFLIQELQRPPDVDALARAATSQETAAQIYTASLLAIDLDSEAERGYLAMLAARLKLPKELVDHLHATVRATAASG